MVVIVVIIAILILYILAIYNIIIRKMNAVKHARSSIEVYLNQRFNLIPNLIECVKEYTNYEKNLFEKIAKLRMDYMKEKELTKGGILNTEVNKTMLVLENYPELKSSKQFINLQKNLTKMENQIQASRRIYNNEVEKYNDTIKMFPNNIVANLFKFKEQEFFQMEE